MSMNELPIGNSGGERSCRAKAKTEVSIFVDEELEDRLSSSLGVKLVGVF